VAVPLDPPLQLTFVCEVVAVKAGPEQPVMHAGVVVYALTSSDIQFAEFANAALSTDADAAVTEQLYRVLSFAVGNMAFTPFVSAAGRPDEVNGAPEFQPHPEL
jgi:hypothetical protein